MPEERLIPPPPVKLSVVVVSYNVRYYLEQCLRSVFRALVGIPAEVWVVDNASRDGSVPYLSERFPQAHFIANSDNHGFSRANNMAIRQAQGEYVLLLNPDTLLPEDTLRRCLAYLDTHPTVGATGVRMLNPDGTFAPESRRGLPTPFTSFCKMTGLGTLFPRSRVFGKYYMRYLDIHQPAAIEVISGAFCMVRHEAFRQVGLMDEDFFMYGEDIDLSYRLLQAGWQCHYLPCPILHYKGESTVKSSYRYVHVFYQAMLIFFNKHFGHRYMLLGWIVKLAVMLRALVDLCQRWLMALRTRLGIRPRPYMPGFISFDASTTTVKEMLERLEQQPQGQRRWIEIIHPQAGLVVRPGEVLPLNPQPSK